MSAPYGKWDLAPTAACRKIWGVVGRIRWPRWSPAAMSPWSPAANAHITRSLRRDARLALVFRHDVLVDRAGIEVCRAYRCGCWPREGKVDRPSPSCSSPCFPSAVSDRRGPGLPIPYLRSKVVGTHRLEASTWEELLDLWREFGAVPIRNCACRAQPNVNSFQVNSLEQSGRRSLVWHETCDVSGNS